MDHDPLHELRLLLRPAGGGLYLVSTGRAEQLRLQRRFYAADSEAEVTARFHADLLRLAEARVAILGIPSDVGAGFRRGANLGPQAIRARLLDDDPDFRAHAAARGIVDLGDVFVVPQLLHDDMLSESQLISSRAALYPDAPQALRERLPVSPLSIAERALTLMFELNPRLRPFVIGGDHSAAHPVVRALHGAGRRFCIVQLDAHTDLLPERLGVEVCFATWSYHANNLIGRSGRLLQVGTRATRHPKQHWEHTLDVRQFWPADYVGNDAQLLDDVVAAARATGLPVYLSNDIDGTDAAFADATGTPEPAGLSVSFVRALISRLGSEVGLIAADMMEVAPPLAPNDGAQTVGVAADYTRDSLAMLLGESA